MTLFEPIPLTPDEPRRLRRNQLYRRLHRLHARHQRRQRRRALTAQVGRWLTAPARWLWAGWRGLL